MKPASDQTPRTTKGHFQRISQAISAGLGTSWAFLIALLGIVAWAATGPIFHYSDGWQLVVNTTTSVITFLMVFLIQNTQNRDAKAIHIKLDELIRAIDGARNRLVNLQDLTDDELDRLHREFQRLHDFALREEARDRTKEAHAAESAR